MPFMLSALISLRANRHQSRSPASQRNQRKLYFPPGGHTHDRHTIPPDRLRISLSDPVLVAAEETLSSTPNKAKSSIIKESRATKDANPRLVVSRLSKGRFLSRRSGTYKDGSVVAETVDSKMSSTFVTSLRNSWKTGFRGAAVKNPNSPDSPQDSHDIVEEMSMSFIDISLGNADRSTSENSQHGPDLAPLASEAFKEELYIRGYMKRPASRPTTVVSRKPRTTFTLMNRFPKVLGRSQGRMVAETLRVEQDAASGAHLSATRSVTLQVRHVDDLESPGMDTTTSTSESFDLHEFSYITAFTTPPSSPSIVLDAELFDKGVPLVNTRHVV